MKPENIAVLDEDLLHVKLSNFSLSEVIGPESFSDVLCGTPSYVAPEILADDKNRKYTKAVDIWSLGVVLYICLCGFPPFSDDLYSKDFPFTQSQQIKVGRFDYPSPYWDPVGDPARKSPVSLIFNKQTDTEVVDLIDSMLVVDPEQRFTIDQCMAHPWMTQTFSGENDPQTGPDDKLRLQG
ncbi:protein kinase [Candidatus Bathyarchaeota archaeon]|nr:protein kinase [Candidatus Bathyarchaeota archaeon]